MSSSLLRKLLIAYSLLMLVCGLGYARWDNYKMDGDGVAFMDMADGLTHHHAALAVNGYWNPAYAAALAIGQAVAHPALWHELQIYYYVNLAIFAAAMLACLFFTQGLIRLRKRFNPEGQQGAAVPPLALHFAGLALLFTSFQRELPLGAVRSDSLLLVFLLLAAGTLLRLQAANRGWRLLLYPALGLALGLAYLTKSFAFLPSCLLIAGLFMFGYKRRDKNMLVGSALTLLVFGALAGPYIAGISLQRHHLTAGDSAPINYCFFVDQTPRWHEWYHHDLGHALGSFHHPEAVLLDQIPAVPGSQTAVTTAAQSHPPFFPATIEQPAVFSYARHAVGTYPLWFDPAYFTEGLKPHFWLHGHIERIVRDGLLLLRFMLGHLEGVVLLIVLFATGARLPRGSRGWLPWLPCIVWGLLMFAMYFPVDVQDRYLTVPYLLVFLPALALLRNPFESEAERARGEMVMFATTCVVVLLAGLALADATRDLAQRQRMLVLKKISTGAYDKEIYSAAAALRGMGVAPGDKLACMGQVTCVVDMYWARLAGAQILGEIEVPDEMDAVSLWNGIADKQQVLDALAQERLKVVVTNFPSSAAAKPAGWVELGDTHYYAYSLTPMP